MVNPRENASAIVLRSGKEVETPHKTSPVIIIDDDIEKEEAPVKTQVSSPKVTTKPPISVNTLPPFPSKFVKSKKEEQEKEILEMFRKVEVNIPLLDAVRQVP